jgi:metal-responsive CopG/Arc/MetJ family transcriptional regulator
MGRAVGQEGNVTVARTHVVMADEVLEAVDRLVGQRGRSRFLEEAAREKLTRVELEAALQATAGVIRTADHPEWRDREATTAWVSEVREDQTS